MSNEVYRSNAHPSWMWIPVIIAAGLLVAFLAAGLAYRASPPASSVYPWTDWWFPGWFFFVPLLFIAFFGLRWFLWGGLGWGWRQGYYDDPAVEALRRRYASGEITKEQFEQVRRDLQSGS